MDSSQHKKNLLSTSSPEGIHIAAQITPARLASLLIRKGPLPIRHITAQLALEVHGFDLLSSSKQRRLIMAAMEQTDAENNVVFEKIGWGQWAVRHIDSDYIVTEGSEGNLDTAAAAHAEPASPINVNDLRNQPNLKLGWTKKQKDPRRESITNAKANLHNLKVPNEQLLSSSAIESDSSDSEQDDEDAIDDDSFSDDNDHDTDELFTFDHDADAKKRSPPIQFANRVPLKLSPPPGPATARRKSSSSHNVNKNTNYNPRHFFMSRSRLNSLENLDNYIISSARNSNGSFSSPPPPPPNVAAAALSGSPITSWSSNHMHNSTSPDSIMATMTSNRRKSSFTESSIRSTLSSSLPKFPSGNHSKEDRHLNNLSDTDEEDWATIGAESLRSNTQKPADAGRRPPAVKQEDSDETKAAAFALVNLMSV